MHHFNQCLKAFGIALILLLLAFGAQAQTTVFTYQGRLTDTSLPANGSYDLQFSLFDAATGGNQIGPTQSSLNVTVSTGVFTVQLDFGPAFNGAPRYLEIAVKQNSNPTYTTLLPRQVVTSAPYSIRSLQTTLADNSQKLGGVAANQFVLTTDARLTDARNPLPGSGNYIQNSTVQQASTNFNISGNGTASGALSGDTINAVTQFNLNGSRILSADLNNLFAGVGAGVTNTGGQNNAFFGQAAGVSNSTGSDNSFFGGNAGFSNTGGGLNSFFGRDAGLFNTTGSYNSFFGWRAGRDNTTGDTNSFFGFGAGLKNTTGRVNSFFGNDAGGNNTTGGGNAFFGVSAGIVNTSGDGNSFFGTGAGQNNTTGQFNTSVGNNAGQFNTTGNRNSSFGLAAGEHNKTGDFNAFFGDHTGLGNTTGSNNTYLGADSDSADGLDHVTVVGSEATASTSNSVVLGRPVDTVRIPGNLVVTGTVSKGGGSFKIDDPLDPENKTLSHSFVESPDMMNIYNGNITTDARGTATIILPAYFSALNREFRYQLTVIGQFAQAIVSEEIHGNQFSIKTDKPHVKVSWLVTGIRHDKFAEDRRIPIEESKPAGERGKCLYEPACRKEN